MKLAGHGRQVSVTGLQCGNAGGFDTTCALTFSAHHHMAATIIPTPLAWDVEIYIYRPSLSYSWQHEFHHLAQSARRDESSRKFSLNVSECHTCVRFAAQAGQQGSSNVPLPSSKLETITESCLTLRVRPPYELRGLLETVAVRRPSRAKLSFVCSGRAAVILNTFGHRHFDI